MTKSTQVVPFAQQFPAVVARSIDESTWSALCNSIYPGAKPESVLMAVDYCRAKNIDVMLKPVHLVGMSVRNAQTNQSDWRDVPMPGIGLYRIQADRSGNYAGSDEPVFGEEITKVFIDKNGKEVTHTFPKWCSYTVYKFVNGNRVSFTAKELWLENYATDSGKSTAPNSMWLKRSYGQLAKCAEAQALRKAWPEVGQDVTAEEMEGKGHEIDVTPIQPQQKAIQSTNAAAALSAAKKTKQAAPVNFDDEPEQTVLPPEALKLLSLLEDCQDIDQVNAWAADAAAQFPQGSAEFATLEAAYQAKYNYFSQNQ